MASNPGAEVQAAFEEAFIKTLQKGEEADIKSVGKILEVGQTVVTGYSPQATCDYDALYSCLYETGEYLYWSGQGFQSQCATTSGCKPTYESWTPMEQQQKEGEIMGKLQEVEQTY